MTRLHSMVLAAALLLTAPAAASVITLDFEGIGNRTEIGGFYGGDGVTFSRNALAANASRMGTAPNGSLSFEDPRLADGTFGPGIAVMNVAAGFDIGLSFFYSIVDSFYRDGSPLPGFGMVKIYSELNATGQNLASVELPSSPGAGNGRWGGVFGSAGLAFTGTARSVLMGVRGFALFDNLTLGSVNPGLSGGLDRPMVEANVIYTFDTVVLLPIDADASLPAPTVMPLPASLPFLLAGLVPIAALRRLRRHPHAAPSVIRMTCWGPARPVRSISPVSTNPPAR